MHICRHDKYRICFLLTGPPRCPLFIQKNLPEAVVTRPLLTEYEIYSVNLLSDVKNPVQTGYRNFFLPDNTGSIKTLNKYIKFNSEQFLCPAEQGRGLVG